MASSTKVMPDRLEAFKSMSTSQLRLREQLKASINRVPKMPTFKPRFKRGLSIVESDLNKKSESWKVVLLSAAVFGFSFVIAAILGFVEKWSALDTVYFGVVTMTTVGYGDQVPRTSEGKIITSFFILYNFVLLTWALTVLTEYLADQVDDLKEDGNSSEPSTQSPRRAIAISLLRVLLAICLGVVVGVVQEKDFATSFYLSIVTLTTVGYGDERYGDGNWKVFAIFYIFVGCYVVGKAIGACLDAAIQSRKRKLQQKILQDYMSETDLQVADADASGELTEAEFVLFKLQRMGAIDPVQLQEIKDHFYTLDIDGSGSISHEEAMRDAAEKKSARGKSHDKRKSEKERRNSNSG